ncbi:MAG TPA: S41 family peptidase [Steroidobacteraceae bacterium]
MPITLSRVVSISSALSLTALLGGSYTYADPPADKSDVATFPDTAAGAALRWWLDAFNSGDAAQIEAYCAEYRPGEPCAARMIPLSQRTGGFEQLSIRQSQPHHIEFLVTEKTSGGRLRGTLDMGAGDNAKVTGIMLTPIPKDAVLDDVTLDSAARGKIIEGAVAQLNENYVDVNMAKKMAAAVRARQKHGDYDAALMGDRFAEIVTADFRAVSHDKHLRLSFSPARVLVDQTFPSAAELEQNRKDLERNNCFFERVEVLPGNIGYLKFNAFAEQQFCAPTAIAAMNFLGNVDALIVDLRDNGGGSPAMVTLVSSYLFAEPTHLNDLWTRKGEITRQYWTLPYVPGKRLADKPVFVLTSTHTFSGAEEFSYNLKTLKRATIVGETTGGGAHPVAPHSIDEHFTIFVPFAKAINPTTKTNWEGVGVEPDVKVPAADALATAQKLAGERFSRGARVVRSGVGRDPSRRSH